MILSRPHSVLCSLCFLLLISGCATPLQTPSGAPEITIHGKSLEEVKQPFCNYLADRGFTLRRHEGSVVEADKNASSSQNILLGDLAHPTTQNRVVFNFLDSADGIRVVYHGFNLSHAHGELELRGDWARVQWNLETIAAQLENRPPPPEPPPAKSPRISAR